VCGGLASYLFALAELAFRLWQQWQRRKQDTFYNSYQEPHLLENVVDFVAIVAIVEMPAERTK
jgi:hypothetical protein